MNNKENLDKAFLGCNQISTESLLSFLFNDEGSPINSRIKQVKYTYKGESGIYINENPIEEGLFGYLDSQDLNEKIQLLEKYFSEYKEEAEIQFKQVKLILLGNTEVGKTTFFDILNSHKIGYKLKSKGGDSTHGVNISTTEYRNEKKNILEFVLKVYDFGGQDYYHSTHWPYFSQLNTHYFLIFRSDLQDEYSVNGKNESLFPLTYWLDSIKKTFKNNDTESKINVDFIQNLYPSKEQSFQELNLKDLKKEFAGELILNVQEPFNFKTRRDNLDKKRNVFRKELTKRLKEKTSSVISMTVSRYDFVKQLKKSPKGLVIKNDISFQNKTQEWIDISLDFAHSTNDIIYTSKGKLKDYVITDIGIFNTYIFKILKNEEDGYFNKNAAIERLSGSELNDNEVQFVLDFMIEFEIIFKTKENCFLAPAFLSNQLSVSEEILANTFDRVLLEYRFKAHFHSNIFAKIVIAFSKDNKLLEDGWKYVLKKGYVFLYEYNSGPEKEGKGINRNLLYIKFLLQPQPTIKVYNHSLFGVNDNFIERIHLQLDELLDYTKKSRGRIDKLVYNKYNNCVNYVDLVNDTRYIIDGKKTDLIQYKKEFFRKGDFRIFLDPEERNKLKMKKIFISYSKFDEVYKDEFKSHLATLKSQDLVETFDDRDIESGSKFDAVIKQKIKDCDIFICLISRHFLNVKYIFEQEFPYALEHKKRVIPIIVKPCDWEGMPIGDKGEKLGEWNAHNKAQVLTLKPILRNEESQVIISEYSSAERDMMWLNVIKEIRNIIENN